MQSLIHRDCRQVAFPLVADTDGDSLPDGVDRSRFVSPAHVRYPSLDPGVQVPALVQKEPLFDPKNERIKC